MVAALFLFTLETSALAVKRRPAPVVQPDLRIVSVAIAPERFTPGEGTVNFTVEVELPKDLDRTLLLEVSSLISSPSRRSMRFLTSRHPVDQNRTAIAAEPSSPEGPKPRVEVILSWDGLDQAKQAVGQGGYSYEIRAKLLTVSEAGARTQMVSWPKRGTLLVLEPGAPSRP